jgi:hypothetical protein
VEEVKEDSTVSNNGDGDSRQQPDDSSSSDSNNGSAVGGPCFLRLEGGEIRELLRSESSSENEAEEEVKEDESSSGSDGECVICRETMTPPSHIAMHNVNA